MLSLWVSLHLPFNSLCGSEEFLVDVVADGSICMFDDVVAQAVEVWVYFGVGGVLSQ